MVRDLCSKAVLKIIVLLGWKFKRLNTDCWLLIEVNGWNPVFFNFQGKRKLDWKIGEKTGTSEIGDKITVLEWGDRLSHKEIRKNRRRAKDVKQLTEIFQSANVTGLHAV